MEENEPARKKKVPKVEEKEPARKKKVVKVEEKEPEVRPAPPEESDSKGSQKTLFQF